MDRAHRTNSYTETRDAYWSLESGVAIAHLQAQFMRNKTGELVPLRGRSLGDRQRYRE